MFEIRTSVEIEATAEEVWAVISDFSVYPEWNPYVRRIDGWPERGEKLEVEFVLASGEMVTIKPRILEAVRPERLSWRGRKLLPGLLDCEHHYFIEQRQNGIRFHHGKRFRGLMVSFVKPSIESTHRAALEAMNRSLKRRIATLQKERESAGYRTAQA